MPRYDYECCGETFERFCHSEDRHKVICPSCGHPAKLIITTAPAAKFFQPMVRPDPKTGRPSQITSADAYKTWLHKAGVSNEDYVPKRGSQEVTSVESPKQKRAAIQRHLDRAWKAVRADTAVSVASHEPSFPTNLTRAEAT